MLILNFESGTRFQDLGKNNHHFGLFSTPFSLDIYKFFTWKLSDKVQLDTDLEEKFNIVSLLEFYNNNNIYPETNIPGFTIFMILLFLSMHVGIYIYEKLF